MGHAAKPNIERLPAKLLAIRKQLGVNQQDFVRLLNLKGYGGRISEFESGRRQPNVLVLMAYARAAQVPLENLIDDNLDLPL